MTNVESMSARKSTMIFLCGVAMLAMLQVAASAQVLCFSTTVPSKAIRLQLTLPRPGTLIGVVRYERGSDDILLLHMDELAVPSPTQVPAVVQTTFAELIDGQRTGQYVLTTQGGAVGGLTYSRQKDKKALSFYEDHEATTADACDWSRRSAGGGTQ
jgi:hypothetical protein